FWVHPNVGRALMTIQHIAVIGAGTMGNGITQVAATSGYAVTMIDVFPGALDKGRATIQKSVAKLHEKGRLTSEQVEAVERLRTSADLGAAVTADVVIEAATENAELKLKIFRDLDQLTPPSVILASNTSSISLTRIGGATKRGDKVIGMHFMNPVPVMTLVEIVRGLATSEDTHNTITALAQTMGKTPVTVNDSPGFVSNRILCPMINEAVFALEEGVGTKEAIDTVMKLG